MSQYPDVDKMMAETIVMMHEQGKLSQFINQDTKQEEAPTTGKIEVVSPEKNEAP